MAIYETKTLVRENLKFSLKYTGGLILTNTYLSLIGNKLPIVIFFQKRSKRTPQVNSRPGVFQSLSKEH